jgi:hypothetical protein
VTLGTRCKMRRTARAALTAVSQTARTAPDRTVIAGYLEDPDRRKRIPQHQPGSPLVAWGVKGSAVQIRPSRPLPSTSEGVPDLGPEPLLGSSGAIREAAPVGVSWCHCVTDGLGNGCAAVGSSHCPPARGQPPARTGDVAANLLAGLGGPDDAFQESGGSATASGRTVPPPLRPAVHPLSSSSAVSFFSLAAPSSGSGGDRRATCSC